MIFKQDERSFSLKATPLQNIERLYTGLWLALVAVHEIPPHIALISEGKYYSLSTRKVDNGTPLERFLNTLERKKTPIVFVNITVPAKILSHSERSEESQLFQGCFTPFNMTNSLQNIYKDLQPLKNTETTCLSPIKEFFAACYSTAFLQTTYVFELLTIAEQQGLVKEAKTLFCNNGSSNCITLPKYTMERIRNKIHQIASQIPSFNS